MLLRQWCVLWVEFICFQLGELFPNNGRNLDGRMGNESGCTTINIMCNNKSKIHSLSWLSFPLHIRTENVQAENKVGRLPEALVLTTITASTSSENRFVLPEHVSVCMCVWVSDGEKVEDQENLLYLRFYLKIYGFFFLSPVVPER